jgi:hypothetical protein
MPPDDLERATPDFAFDLQPQSTPPTSFPFKDSGITPGITRAHIQRA